MFPKRFRKRFKNHSLEQPTFPKRFRRGMKKDLLNCPTFPKRFRRGLEKYLLIQPTFPKRFSTFSYFFQRPPGNVEKTCLAFSCFCLPRFRTFSIRFRCRRGRKNAEQTETFPIRFSCFRYIKPEPKTFPETLWAFWRFTKVFPGHYIRMSGSHMETRHLRILRCAPLEKHP